MSRSSALLDAEKFVDDLNARVRVTSASFGRAAHSYLRYASNTSSSISLKTDAWSLGLALWALAGRAAYGLTPSFLQSSRQGNTKPERVHPTAYLDGMRGLAAFAVFLCHLSYQCYVIQYGYGHGEPGENNYLIQLPIIRLFYSGPPMVAIFFIISGYALSFKPLKQMRARQFDALMQTLSSSVFRRPVRLYLPCVASTFLVLIMVRMGIYAYTLPFSENKTYLRAIHEDHVMRKDTLMEQLSDWLAQMFDSVHAWDFSIYSGSTIYDRHLWTIPTEFRASLALFLSLLMTARMLPWLRLITFAGLIYWALQWNRWEMILFWAGPILAELDQIRLSRAAVKAVPAPTENGLLHVEPAPVTKPAAQSKRWRWFFVANFILGLYLASYPDFGGDDTPGFRYLSTWIPKYYSERLRFWQSIGAIQIIWSVNNTLSLQELFNGPVVQYLGKISYAIYLMHGPVIHSFGYTIMPIIWSITGVETRWRYDLGFFICSLFIIPVTVWASDVFMRAADIPIVNFGKWLESKLLSLKSAPKLSIS